MKTGHQLHAYKIPVGTTVEADSEITLVPRLNLAELRRGDQIHQLKAGDTFTVLSIDTKADASGNNGGIWYKVTTDPEIIIKRRWYSRPEILTHWINSTALLGKVLREKMA